MRFSQKPKLFTTWYQYKNLFKLCMGFSIKGLEIFTWYSQFCDIKKPYKNLPDVSRINFYANPDKSSFSLTRKIGKAKQHCIQISEFAEKKQLQ